MAFFQQYALPVPNTVLLRLPIKMCSANKAAAEVQIITIIKTWIIG